MPIKKFNVKSVSWSNHIKVITLQEQGTDSPPKQRLTVPRSACVSTSDVLATDDGKVWVCCNDNSTVSILPSYVARESVSLGNLQLEFLIKEITAEDEFSAYQSLTQFHYRGHSLHGRTARLIIRSFHPIYPKVVGYIELATPFYMNKPRTQVLSAPFEAHGISWQTWDMPTIRRYINSIVRIARCVIYPEFRGLGLGQRLIHHAMIFARNRWHVGGLKPVFIEVSADMLKFVPFAAKAGMMFIGETDGNLGRVAEDIAYLLKNKGRIEDKSLFKDASIGILDKQISRMNQAAALMEREGWSLEDLTSRLDKLSPKSALRDFDLFHEVVSLPKPTYMQGLVPEAVDFLKERSACRRNPSKSISSVLCDQFEPLTTPVVFEKISLQYQGHVQRTYQSHAIQQAFGISPDDIEHTVLKDISFSIKPGEIILLTGPSGSGKTSVLKLLAQEHPVGLSGKIQWPVDYRPGTFSVIKSKKALIELFARKDVEEALCLMGMVGLSDAFIYLKRFDELSNGQQYRAMLANLIASGCNLWIADEFCSNLDTITANLVSSRLQSIARRLGATVVVASSQPENFVSSLAPDHVLKLTSAWEYQYIPGSSFIEDFATNPVRARIPTMSISPLYMKIVRSGQKSTTIRKGRKRLLEGFLLLESGSDSEPVTVKNIRYTRFSSLTEQDARNDGFSDLKELHKVLTHHYPDLRENSLVTIVNFNLIGPPYSL